MEGSNREDVVDLMNQINPIWDSGDSFVVMGRCPECSYRHIRKMDRFCGGCGRPIRGNEIEKLREKFNVFEAEYVQLAARCEQLEDAIYTARSDLWSAVDEEDIKRIRSYLHRALAENREKDNS